MVPTSVVLGAGEVSHQKSQKSLNGGPPAVDLSWPWRCRPVVGACPSAHPSSKHRGAITVRFKSPLLHPCPPHHHPSFASALHFPLLFRLGLLCVRRSPLYLALWLRSETENIAAPSPNLAHFALAIAIIADHLR